MVRRGSDRDLRWGSLTPDDWTLPSGERTPYVNPGSFIPRDIAGIAGLVNTSRNRLRLAGYLRECHVNGVKAVLRVIHEGAANKDAVPVPDPDCVTDPRSWEAEGKNTRRDPKLDESATVTAEDERGVDLAILWAEEHLYDPVEDYRTPVEEHRFPPEADQGDRCAYHLESLDMSAPYKRQYMQLIAEQIGELLIGVAEDLWVDNGLRLSDVVDAFEYLNEVDNVAFYVDESGEYDVGTSGAYVGKTFFRMAWGLRRVLRTRSDVVGDIPMMLPTLASYVEDTEAPHEWADKIAYLGELTRGVVEELTLYRDKRETAGVDPEVEYADLLELVQEIDYHWYHRKEDLRHIAYLVHEVDEVRRAIGEGMDAVLEKTARNKEKPDEEDEVRAFKGRFDDTGVRIHEGGVSLGESDTIPDPWRGDGELWQAHEVFRRIGGHLASAATQAGWWSWISGVAEEFEGTGLRKEPDAGSVYWRKVMPFASTSWDPGRNVQRLSWYAYRRLSELLRDRVLRGRMVLPASTSREDIPRALDAQREDCRGLVVFEYTLHQRTSRDPAYAYLVLNDDSAGSGTAAVRGSPEVAGTGVEVVPLMSEESFPGRVMPMGSGLTTRPPTDELPFEEVSYRDRETLTAPVHLQVAVAGTPVFLYAPVRLDWSCEAVAASPPGMSFVERPPGRLEPIGVSRPHTVRPEDHLWSREELAEIPR